MSCEMNIYTAGLYVISSMGGHSTRVQILNLRGKRFWLWNSNFLGVNLSSYFVQNAWWKNLPSFLLKNLNWVSPNHSSFLKPKKRSLLCSWVWKHCCGERKACILFLNILVGKFFILFWTCISHCLCILFISDTGRW